MLNGLRRSERTGFVLVALDLDRRMADLELVVEHRACAVQKLVVRAATRHDEVR